MRLFFKKKKNSGKHQAVWGREIQVKEEWKSLWPAWSHSTPRLRTSPDADISRALSTGQLKERLGTQGRTEKSRGFVASTECSWCWSWGLITQSFPLTLTTSYFSPPSKLSKRHLRVTLSQSRYWKGHSWFPLCVSLAPIFILLHLIAALVVSPARGTAHTYHPHTHYRPP